MSATPGKSVSAEVTSTPSTEGTHGSNAHVADPFTPVPSNPFLSNTPVSSMNDAVSLTVTDSMGSSEGMMQSSPRRVSSKSASSPPGSPGFEATLQPSTPMDVTVLSSSRMPQSAPGAARHLDSAAPKQPFSEHRPRAAPNVGQQPQQNQQQQPVSRPIFDDDENTEPSTANNTAADSNQPAGEGQEESGAFQRLWENTRKLVAPHKDSEEDQLVDGVLISGYLKKLSRNGKWQTRWFETDGECLSYFKSEKRKNLLATLELDKVGQIEIDETDPSECCFSIQVKGRLYKLRADSPGSCRDWVISLNRVKEAHMNQGNVKLVQPRAHPIDLLDQSTDVTPRVVVVANRERTHHVDEWDRLEPSKFNGHHHRDNSGVIQYDEFHHKRRTAIGNVVIARWTKRKPALANIGRKLAKWARSIRNLSCTTVEGVHLDTDIHPPGHSDNSDGDYEEDNSGLRKMPATRNAATMKDDHSDWIGREKTISQSAPTGTEVTPVPQEGEIHKNTVVDEDVFRVLS